MITPRQEVLLASIIEEYIETAKPISSKSLEKTGLFGVSSATIRAEMNELERLGYLTHLYTSSGRIPTDKAYRFFVDNLLDKENCEPAAGYKRKIKIVLQKTNKEPREINKAIAQLLSELSDNLVIAGIPERADFFKVGLSSLFEFPEFREFERVFRLADFFDEFEEMFNKLERAFWSSSPVVNEDNGEDIKIFIGRENPVRDIKDETVMLARYNLPYNYKGSLALIGPTRMDYSKNIGLIRYATRELNKLSK